ncbi:PREDICTED: uncharacterized protein LOC109188256 isoform X1 [Ipomoea nil]|uniref:uncharacterized protein LOC109188256 isoform X1 n=1 Tax=Ipomoea nil TaxID=35883 RepID=UPI000900E60E|nr:PREDICTED: uncharacterized protein LOC109188256 isoform X1 [Ipomoea nil]
MALLALPFNPCNCLSIKSSDPRKPLTHIPPAQLKTPTPYPEPKLIVTGGSKLSGHVAVSGSKNSALPILAATLCCSGSSKLQNVPDLSDTRTMASILESLGAKVDIFGGEMVVNAGCIKSVEPDSSQIGKLRGGFFVLGPLLARFGEAVVGLPGGCDIGARPVDLYIKGLRALGAVVQLRDGKVHAHAANGKGLVGGKIWLDYPSVGATETLMMAASMAEGKTVLSNAAQEPEVIDLARFLTKCGACIEGAGTDTVYINGRDRFHGSEFSIMPDRIEAGSFMLAAAITRSCISISHVVPSHLSCLIDKLSGAGCRIIWKTCDTLEISAVPRTTNDDLQGFDIKTRPFPGFPTDLQPPTMALLSTCNGSSSIEESVFDNRMGHVKELQKFGVKIQVCGSKALVFGKKNSNHHLVGSHVTATDLRGGMSLVLAALAAEGITEIGGISHLYRGYENLEMKLQGLGARIKV